MNIAQPENPTLITTVDLGGRSLKLCLAGDYAYISCVNSSANLQIIDISNPAKPVITGSLAGDFHHITVSGNYLYSTSSTSLTVVDISNPSEPVITGEMATISDPATLYVLDNYVYASYNNGTDRTSRLDIIDATDPGQPVVSSTISLPYRNYSVNIKDRHLMYTCSNVLTDGTQASGGSWVYILNASRPRAPYLAGVIDGGGFTHSVTVRDSIVYIADGQGGMKITDASNPSDPLQIGRVALEGTTKIALSGDYAYMAAGTGGLGIVDISDTQAPRLQNTLPTFDNAVDVAASGTTVFVGDNPWGLTVVDVANPNDPRVISNAKSLGESAPPPPGSLFQPDPDAWKTRQVSISGNIVCLAVDLLPHIRVVDISDPVRPLQEGFIYENSGDLEVSGDLLYLPTTTGGSLRIYDISNPRAPVLKGACGNIAGFYSKNLVLAGDYIYLSDRNRAIARVDVSDPAQPVYRGSIKLEARIQDITVSGNYLYTAMGADERNVLIFKLE